MSRDNQLEDKYANNAVSFKDANFKPAAVEAAAPIMDTGDLKGFSSVSRKETVIKE